jgi:hypothetical protein
MSFEKTRLNVNDAARLLGVRTTELKEAIQKGELLRGVEPPKLMRKQGDHGWVFLAGDVMAVAEKLK